MPRPDDVSVEDLDRAPSSLPAPPQAFTPEAFHLYIDRFTIVTDENFRIKEELSSLRRNLETSKELDKLIGPYAKYAFRFMCGYCGFVALIIVLSGFSIRGFKIEASVLQILVGSTAVTVFGLVGMVLTGIFVGARKLSR